MKKNLRIIYFIILGALTIVSSFVISFTTSIYGLVVGLLFFATPYSMKFVPPEPNAEKINWLSGSYIYGSGILVVLAITYFNYAMVFLAKNGIDRTGVIISIDTTVELEGSGSHSYSKVYYYCRVNTYSKKIQCSKHDKKGDKIYYLFSPDLPNTAPILYRNKEPRFNIILNYGGVVFFASIIFLLSLFLTWFHSLFKIGMPVMMKKIATEVDKEVKEDIIRGKPEEKAISKNRLVLKLLYQFSYFVSFSVFVLFIIATLKNLYLNIPFRFWSIGLTTLAIIIILITDWGERLYKISNHIIFSTKNYRIISYVAQGIKIIVFLGFGQLLYATIIHADKSFLEVILDFIKNYFNLNLKAIKDFFKPLFKS